jgi:phosphocarrier protein HPr
MNCGPLTTRPADTPDAVLTLMVLKGPSAMNGETLQQKVVITNAQGLHMRPLTAFAEMAGRFQSGVTVIKEDKRVNGKSPLDLMLLAAEQGTELIIEASGADAAQALDALVELLRGLANEDAEPPLPPKG